MPAVSNCYLLYFMNLLLFKYHLIYSDMTCKQSNRSNRKVIDWSQIQCDSNILKIFKCKSNRFEIQSSTSITFYHLSITI